MRHRVIQMNSLAGAMLLASGLVGTALGQEFRLQQNVEGAPGEVVEVQVFATGGANGSQTAAFNFTVSANDTNLADGQAITGSKANTSALDDFLYQDNAPSRSGGKEYRAVLYSPSSSAGTIDTTTERHIATVRVPIAQDAADGATIDLAMDRVGGDGDGFDDDDVTALRGISDNNGNSLVPGQDPATSRPDGIGTQLTVVEQENVLANIPFDGSPDISDRWEYAQVLPAPSREVRTTGASEASGLTIDVSGEHAFGFWQTKPSKAQRVVPSSADQVLFYSWRLSYSKTDPAESPTMRLRASAGDGSVGVSGIYEEIGPESAPVLIPTSGNEKVFTNSVYTASEHVNGDAGDGFTMALDMLSYFKPGVQGANVTAKGFVAEQVPVSELANEAQVYSYDGSTDGTPSGFTFAQLPEIAGGTGAESIEASDGIGVELLGEVNLQEDFGDPNEDGKFPNLEFPFGFWSGTLDGWTVDSSKVYRLDYTLRSTADNRVNTHKTRLRFSAGEQDYKYLTEVASEGLADSTYSPETDADGKTYTEFLMFPSELDGQQVLFSFDVYGVSPTDNGGVVLRDLNVRSYDMPNLTTLP